MKLDLERNRMRLAGVRLSGHRIEGADLRNAIAQQSVWEGIEFKNCRFEHADFSGSVFSKVTFTDCRFGSTNLMGRFAECTFTTCHMDHTSFVASYFSDCTFVAVRAQFSNWARATITDSKLDVDLRGAHMNLAETQNVDWTGSNFWSAVMPWNCAFVSGNVFSDQQVQLMAGLLLTAKVSDESRAKLEAVTTTHAKKVIERMVRPGVSVEIPDQEKAVG